MPEQRPYLSGEEWINEILEGEKDFSNTTIEDVFDATPHIENLNSYLRTHNLRQNPIYLENSEIHGLTAPGIYLPFLKGRKSDFSYSTLSDAWLQGGDLREGKFERVDFRGAKLWKANFWHAQMPYADFHSNKNLYGIRLVGADCRHVLFSGADMKEAEVREAHFEYADLRRVQLDTEEEDGTTSKRREAFIINLNSAHFHQTKISSSLLWLPMFFPGKDCFIVENTPASLPDENL